MIENTIFVIYAQDTIKGYKVEIKSEFSTFDENEFLEFLKACKIGIGNGVTREVSVADMIKALKME